MIEVEQLSKSYGSRVAIDAISFSARPGEVLGFLGPNGAGKTTTLRILAALLPPGSGRALVAGYDTVTQSLEVRARIGYLPERAPLYDEMTVRAFLRFAGEMKGLSGAERDRAADRAASQTAVSDVRDRVIGRLSRGYRQRVGIAQALLGDPPVLLLDEPTVGLDPKQIIEIRELIRGLGGERTILLSTHILPEVALSCDRVVILARGRVVAVDSPAALADRFSKGERVVVRVDGSGEGIAEVLLRVPGVREASPAAAGAFSVVTDGSSGVRPAIARALVGAGAGVLELSRAERSLEDVFLDLVTEEGKAT